MTVRVLIALALVSGCSDGDPGTGDPADGAAPDGATPGPTIPWLTEGEPPVAPPVLTPCPEGWREVVDAAGPAQCEPYPEGGPATCAADEAHFPGAPGCERIGSTCPPDGLPGDLPADAPVVYALAGATGGDGTRAAPHGALDTFAWGGLSVGTVVAVGRGTYEGIVRIPNGSPCGTPAWRRPS